MKPHEVEPPHDRGPICKDCGEEFELDFDDPNLGTWLCLECFYKRKNSEKEAPP